MIGICAGIFVIGSLILGFCLGKVSGRCSRLEEWRELQYEIEKTREQLRKEGR